MTANLPSSFFTDPPHWQWLIVLYFFIGGLAGGSYFIAALIDFFGRPQDRPFARLGYLVAFPAVVLSGILLIVDLTLPLRFWHMLIESNTGQPMLKLYSPMSLGSWALLAFGFFAFLSFLAALGDAGWGPGRRLHVLRPPGIVGTIVAALGAALGFFVAGYTGVLLSVSNQPVWSDTWALGGLFLASGLSVAAATLVLLGRRRIDTLTTELKLSSADRIFIVLELLLLAAFFVTLGTLAGRLFAPRWIVLWVLVALGTLVPLVMRRAPGRGVLGSPVLAAFLVVLGGLALRIVVVFGAQM